MRKTTKLKNQSTSNPQVQYVRLPGYAGLSEA